MNIGTAVPDAGKERIIRTECPYILDSPDSSPAMIDDEETPAPIVPTDLWSGKVNCAVCEFGAGPVPEERAGIW
jgi:hypothetical protein